MLSKLLNLDRESTLNNWPLAQIIVRINFDCTGRPWKIMSDFIHKVL